jgi:hypothetical protein
MIKKIFDLNDILEILGQHLILRHGWKPGQMHSDFYATNEHVTITMTQENEDKNGKTTSDNSKN